MKLVSWNVNGLRAVMKKGFEESFAQFDADIFALQEIKIQPEQIELELPDYKDVWNCGERKGYSGTAVFSKTEPLQTLYKVGVPTLDAEGRLCALELPEFWLVNVYTPNAQAELKRLDHRMEWDDAFREFCQGLEQASLPLGAEATKPKPIIMCGDFNVAHQDIDLKNPGPNRGKAGFSDEERAKFTALLDAGFTDTFRTLHPDLAGAYSWWSYRFNARANNAGWRIDYFLTSNSFMPHIKGAHIFPEVYGSDHCPVSLDVALV